MNTLPKSNHFETSDFLQLMKIIGLPNNGSNVFANLSEEHLINLLPLAVNNKVPVIFLEHALSKRQAPKSVAALYEKYLQRSRLVTDLIRRTHNTLTHAGTSYALFKTMKPFPFVTVDLDIILFSREDLRRAYVALRRAGAELAGFGPHSITLYSPQHDVGIDLHSEISISHMVYIDKKALAEHVVETEISGSAANVLDEPAELAVVLSHSLYKEQMFTLADYYSTVIRLSNMTEEQRLTLVKLAQQMRVELSLNLALKLVEILTHRAFNRNIQAATKTSEAIRLGKIEEEAMQIALSKFAMSFELPFRFPALTVAAGLFTKSLKDPLMRATLGQQQIEIMTNTSEFLHLLMLRLKRETY